MKRIAAGNPVEAEGKAKQLLDGVKAKIGVSPNLMKTWQPHRPRSRRT
jgi:hypothetical protein